MFSSSPDPKWLPFIRVVLGFVIVIMIVGLGAAIALGKVQKETSYGLDRILDALFILGGGILFGDRGKQ
jgi:hypothetical protein